MTTDRISEFTSDKARARFLAAYERTFDRLWPTDHKALDLPTTFGMTRVYQTGRADGVPIVLLPGGGGNSLMWHRYVARLGQAGPTLAVDPCGEPGGSTHDRPITGGGDLSQWLGEVLTGLKIDRAHLVGCSFGAWTALQHTLHAPNQVATITLLDPPGFGRITPRFLAWVVACGVASLTPRPLRRHAASWLRNTTLLDDDLMRLLPALMSFRRRLPNPPVLTDEELRNITVPALILLGEHSQMHDAAQVAARIRDRMPSAKVELIPGAGHDLPMHSPEIIIDRILAFIDKAEPPA